VLPWATTGRGELMGGHMRGLSSSSHRSVQVCSEIVVHPLSEPLSLRRQSTAPANDASTNVALMCGTLYGVPTF
jgi:hypothetical protein